MALASMLTKTPVFCSSKHDLQHLPHIPTLTSPRTFFSSKSRSSFRELQLFTTKNYTVKTSISAENYSGVVGDCWLLKKNLLRTCEQSHCSIVFSRAQRPTCSCRIFNGCCCEPNLIPRNNKKSLRRSFKGLNNSDTMASPVIQLDRGNNTTCTVNLHGCTIVSWRVNNQEQLFVSKVRPEFSNSSCKALNE